MPMSLQFFSEPGNGGSGDQGQQGNLPAGSQETPPEVKEENTTGKTFSRDEVAKMIAAETKLSLLLRRIACRKRRSCQTCRNGR